MAMSSGLMVAQLLLDPIVRTRGGSTICTAMSGSGALIGIRRRWAVGLQTDMDRTTGGRNAKVILMVSHMACLGFVAAGAGGFLRRIAVRLGVAATGPGRAGTAAASALPARRAGSPSSGDGLLPGTGPVRSLIVVGDRPREVYGIM